MEENKQPIEITDNMPEDVKAIVSYLNSHNIGMDDYHGDSPEDDDLGEDVDIFSGNEEFTVDEISDDDIDISDNAEDQESLSDLNNMF